MADRSTVRHQPGRESDLHADPVRATKPAPRRRGYPDCLGHHHLDVDGDLASIPLGQSRPDPLLRLGLIGNRPATVDHRVELGKMKIWSALPGSNSQL